MAQRKNPEERRREILDAAVALALSEGLGSLTARRVATRIGVQPGLVTHYFGTIDQLVAQVFTQVAREERRALSAAVSPETSALGRVKATLAAFTDPTRDRIGLLWLDAWRQAAERPQLRQAVILEMEADAAALEATISLGVREGEFLVDHPGKAALRILTVLDGQTAVSAIRAAFTESSLDYAVIQAMAFATAERELGIPHGSLQRG